MNPSERKERGEQLLQKMLGPERAEATRNIWQNICPEFENYVVEFLAGEIWSRPAMDLRTRSLVTIASLVALGRPLALELNIRMAINNGATRQDIVETLLQIAPYGGFPACWEGLTVLQKVCRELDSGTEADAKKQARRTKTPRKK
jgi:4-carboxymuconolactone decarboxylase